MVKRLAWTTGICGGVAACLLLAGSATGAVILHDDRAFPADRALPDDRVFPDDRVLPEGGQDRLTAADESTIARTLRFAGTGERTLVIRLINGSIRVSASDDTTVDLQVRKRIVAETDAGLRDAEREVTLDIADNAALIGAIARQPDTDVCGEQNDRNGWWRRPRYQVTFDVTVRVPRGTHLELCTINNGEIRVEQTTGNFEISHVNGRITMNGVRGAGRARTINGAVAVSFAEPPPGASTFRTHNGTVTASFPDGLSADLMLKTFHGGLFTDFDVQPLPQPAPAAVERRGSQSIYQSNAFTRVRVGRGGPEIALETFNGDVRVVRTAR
jgi:hypothetical protein